MLNKMVTKSTDYLINNHVIDEGDRDVYEYGFHSLYNNIFDIASIIIISIFVNQIKQTILYHISFIALRSTAGGFHAKTHFRCFAISTSLWLFSLWAISHAASPVVCIILAGLSFFIIWKWTPIENKNSPLSLEKYRRMKVLSRIIAIVFFVESLIIPLVLPSDYNWINASLVYGMASHMLLIIAVLLYDTKKV